MRRSWRTWRTSMAIDDPSARWSSPADRDLLHVHRAMGQRPPWSMPPVDLLPQTLWSIRHRGAESPVRPLPSGPGWAFSRAVAHAAGLAALALTATLAMTLSQRPAAPTTTMTAPSIASASRSLEDAVSGGLEWLSSASRRPSLREEAHLLATDARTALACFRTKMPRRPRPRAGTTDE